MNTEPAANAAPASPGIFRGYWLTWLALGLLLVTGYWWTFGWLFARWEAPDSYYSHGWLIPPASAFLIWIRRRSLQQCRVKPSRAGILLLLAGLFLHFIGGAWQIGFVSGVSLVVALAGIVLALLGWEYLRRLWFPLLFLLFMIPAPDVTIQGLSFEMKMFAARVSGRIAEAFGVTVAQSGSTMNLLNGRIVVDDVCSGLKYMIALTAFGAVYAYLSRLRWLGKGILLLATIPLALAANIIRVTIMIMAANHWGTQIVDNKLFHGGLGIMVFVCAFLLLFAFESFLMLFLASAKPAEERDDD
jgi:exosortase